jgi:hypothetical protein
MGFPSLPACLQCAEMLQWCTDQHKYLRKTVSGKTLFLIAKKLEEFLVDDRDYGSIPN